jgi:hypothetical protein
MKSNKHDLSHLSGSYLKFYDEISNIVKDHIITDFSKIPTILISNLLICNRMTNNFISLYNSFLFQIKELTDRTIKDSKGNKQIKPLHILLSIIIN